MHVVKTFILLSILIIGCQCSNNYLKKQIKKIVKQESKALNLDKKFDDLEQNFNGELEDVVQKLAQLEISVNQDLPRYICHMYLRN